MVGVAFLALCWQVVPGTIYTEHMRTVLFHSIQDPYVARHKHELGRSEVVVSDVRPTVGAAAASAAHASLRYRRHHGAAAYYLVKSRQG